MSARLALLLWTEFFVQEIIDIFPIVRLVAVRP